MGPVSPQPLYVFPEPPLSTLFPDGSFCFSQVWSRWAGWLLVPFDIERQESPVLVVGGQRSIFPPLPIEWCLPSICSMLSCSGSFWRFPWGNFCQSPRISSSCLPIYSSSFPMAAGNTTSSRPICSVLFLWTAEELFPPLPPKVLLCNLFPFLARQSPRRNYGPHASEISTADSPLSFIPFICESPSLMCIIILHDQSLFLCLPSNFHLHICFPCPCQS